MTIRGAVPSDVGALKAIARRTIAADYGAFLGAEAVAAFIESGACDRYVEDNVGECTVILADGDLAGFCVCKSELIDLMMVDHALHRRGLGTRLLSRCEENLFASWPTLRLESFARNAKANAFYRKNGWREVKTAFDEASGGDKITFAKGRGI